MIVVAHHAEGGNVTEIGTTVVFHQGDKFPAAQFFFQWINPLLTGGPAIHMIPPLAIHNLQPPHPRHFTPPMIPIIELLLPNQRKRTNQTQTYYQYTKTKGKILIKGLSLCFHISHIIN
jgi:hypothetical protein